MAHVEGSGTATAMNASAMKLLKGAVMEKPPFELAAARELKKEKPPVRLGNLLFLIGRTSAGGLRGRRLRFGFPPGGCAPELGCSHAFASPKLSTFDRSDEFAPHRRPRLCLNERLVASLGRRRSLRHRGR
jgi:hypothetical protein